MSDNATAKPAAPGFDTLGLPDPLLTALSAVGYEAASPIQARTIPPLLEGRDIVGQAQTGTGKTAAFALPFLARIDLESTRPQLLVLTPTRELAIQVAESFQRYAKEMPGFHVLPIYGGQAYSLQLRPLRRGVHAVVGTPGRVTDHIRRGSLDLGDLKGLVLDEADEMLHMGFIEDVTWILDQTPKTRQIALFSATMPEAIRRVAKTYLRDPEEITIRERHATADLIRQRYQIVSGHRKLEALTRILEVEEFDGMLIFVRTRHLTATLAEKLEARGYAAAPLSGDISQVHRERTIERLRRGQLDIVVATDVAARGLDVERISHVINFDVPTDTEAYVHRIGRTGRAGRSGDAILFVSPRERRMLKAIERVVRRDLEPMKLPSTADVNRTRIARFKGRIVEAMADPQLDFYAKMVREVLDENEGATPETVAAALARMAQGEQPLLLEERRQEPEETFGRNDTRRGSKFDRPGGPRHGKGARQGPKSLGPSREQGMVRYRIEVGHHHGVRPGGIVSAIANEAGLEGRYIGRIEIYDTFSTVDLPSGMPESTFKALGRARLCQRMLRISPVRPDGKPPRRAKKGQ